MASPRKQQRLWRILGAVALCLLPALPAAAAFSRWREPQGPLWFALGGSLLLTLLFAIACRRLLVRNRLLERTQADAAEHAARLRRSVELAHRRYRHLLDNAGDALFFIDPQSGALQQINRRAEELLGYTAEEIGGLDLSEIFPSRQRRRYLRLLKKVIRDGYGEEGNLLFRCTDGRILNGEVHARLGELGEDRVVHGVLRDVTAMHRIEQELRRKNRDLTLVNEIAHRAAGSHDLGEMLDAVLARVVNTCAADGGGIYVARHNGSALHLVAHRGIGEDILAEIGQMARGAGISGRVVANGKPKASWDVQSDQRLFSSAARRAGWRGFQGIPLVSNDKTVGALFLFNLTNRILSREEVEVLLAIGTQTQGRAARRAGSSRTGREHQPARAP